MIIYIWKPYYLFSRGFKISVWKYWQIFCAHLVVAIVAYSTSAYICEQVIRPFITATGWTGLIVEGALFLITISLFTFVGFYVSSKGFRDIIDRVKIFKKR